MEIPQECFDMSSHNNASYQLSLKSFKSKSELETMPRKDLQQLAKQYGVKANLKNMDIINQLLLIEPSLFAATANGDDSMISGLKRDESEETMLMNDVTSQPNLKRRKSNIINGKDQVDQENVNPNAAIAAVILPSKSKKQSAIKVDKEIAEVKKQQYHDEQDESEKMRELELTKKRKIKEQEKEEEVARKQKEMELIQKAKQLEEEEARKRKEIEELERIKRLKEEEEMKRKLREEEEERQKEMEIKRNKMDFFPIIAEAAKESFSRQQARMIMKQNGLDVAALAIARNNLKSHFLICAKEAAMKAVERLHRREMMKIAMVEASAIGGFRMKLRMLHDLCIEEAVKIGRVKSFVRSTKYEMEKQMKVIAACKHLIRMGKREAAKMGRMKTLKRKASYEVAIKAIERMEEYERLLKSIEMVETLLRALNKQSKLVDEFMSIRNEKEEYIKFDML